MSNPKPLLFSRVVEVHLEELQALPVKRRCDIQVTCGSSDRYVYVWDVASRKILYKLPGHNGSVNEVVFHPDEPILCSASSDRQLYLGELAS